MIPNQGDAGSNGGPFGDLYVFIHVRPHEYFERNGTDLYCALPISLAMASLGGEITLETIDHKKVAVSVPAGTQNTTLLRVRGEGVPSQGGRRGDLYLKVVVNVPLRLSRRGRELLEEFRKIEGEESAVRPVKLSELKR